MRISRNVADAGIYAHFSPEEAEWLKCFIQNFPVDLLDEDPRHEKYRKDLFTALRKLTEGEKQ